MNNLSTDKESVSDVKKTAEASVYGAKKSFFSKTSLKTLVRLAAVIIFFVIMYYFITAIFADFE